MKNLILLIALFPLFSIGQSIERQVIGSTGVELKNSNAQISLTVGEIVTSTFSTSSVSLLQGFQQPDSSDFNTSITLPEKIHSVLAYPNPFTNQITIGLQDASNYIKSINIYNAIGSLVYTRIGNSKNAIELGFLPVGVYHVKVQLRTGSSTLKIVKN